LICAAITLSALSEVYLVKNKYNSAADFLVFVGVMGIVTQAVVGTIRFLNITMVNQYFTIFGLAVSIAITNLIYLKCKMFHGGKVLHFS